MRVEDLAYAAGLFDGEGCISIEKYRKTNPPIYQLTTKLAMTSVATVQWFAEMFGGPVYMQVRKRANERTQAVWRVHSHKAVRFLELVLPYLKTKREQAEVALSYRIYLGSPATRGRPRTQEVIMAQEDHYTRIKALKRVA